MVLWEIVPVGIYLALPALPAGRRAAGREHGEREGEAPVALPQEGATRAPIIINRGEMT